MLVFTAKSLAPASFNLREEGTKMALFSFLETVRMYFNQHPVQMKCHAL